MTYSYIPVYLLRVLGIVLGKFRKEEYPMPRQERIKTKYPGVYYIEANGARGKEKIFYIFYRREGKQIEEKAGGQYADDMTEAKAAGIRADRIRGKDAFQ